MKILVIGDPHGEIGKIKEIPIKNVDLILVTGDIGKADLARKHSFENSDRKKKGLPKKEYGKKEEREAYTEIYNSTVGILKYLSKHSPVYTLLGNVATMTDYQMKLEERKSGLKLPYMRSAIDRIKDVNIVINNLRNINGLRIGFLEYFIDTCWVREFKLRDYKKMLKRARKQTDKARRILKRFGKVDILVCHQPPYGYLDKVTGKYGAPKFYRGKHAGSKVILDYIKKHQPKYVFCGHIHEGEGKAKIGKTEVYNLGVAGHKIVEF
ncbi:MAG: metallophosphoesterase [Nanoarchaeota archaeon]